MKLAEAAKAVELGEVATTAELVEAVIIAELVEARGSGDNTIGGGGRDDGTDKGPFNQQTSEKTGSKKMESKSRTRIATRAHSVARGHHFKKRRLIRRRVSQTPRCRRI